MLLSSACYYLFYLNQYCYFPGISSGALRTHFVAIPSFCVIFCIIPYFKSNMFLYLINFNSCYSFGFLKCSSSCLTIILYRYLFSSLDSSLSTIHVFSYSFLLMSFLWCTRNTTTLPSFSLGSIGFIYSIFPFYCPTPIVGAISDGPCWVLSIYLPFFSVLLQDLCSFLLPCFVLFFLITIAVSPVARDIFCPLQYSPACRITAAGKRGAPLLPQSSPFLVSHPPPPTRL